jgi:hypothetical protein
MIKQITRALLLSITFLSLLSAQSQLLPLDHQLENRLAPSIYSLQHFRHTSIRPFELRDISGGGDLDSLIAGRKQETDADASWLERKVYYEHLLDIRQDEYRLYGDIHADLQLGKDAGDGRLTYVNTRGAAFGGSITEQFSFHTEFYENQALFPSYLEQRVKKDSIVPGQGFQREFSKNIFDYTYSSAVMSYRPSKYLGIQGGHGKNFIGDGYRSMLLSDNAFNYPFIKLTADVWRIKYMALWAEFQNLTRQRMNPILQPWEKKGGIFHYLDVSVTSRLSIGFFEGIIWLPKDSTQTRGFEWNYLNPIIFLRPVEFSINSPDNMLMGLNVRYTAAENVVTYGQFMIDEFTDNEFFSSSGYWGNKYSIQLGGKSFNAFNVEQLFVQGEVNIVRPFTYSHKVAQKNYTHYRQSLADPLGSNFYEYIGIAQYSLDRFQFGLQVNIARFGTDSSAAVNYGSDLSKPYDTRSRNYGNDIGQGVKNILLYGDLRVSYLFNPLTNLRIEGSFTFRSLESGSSTSRMIWFSLGIRSSFRNFYYDF